MAPQSGRIGWRPYVNVVTQVVNAVDADATAFITAAGITNLTQASAINTLVNDLKTYGLWTKMKAIYPMVGGTATSHKFNLKDPRDLDAAFRLAFTVTGWTHTSTGAKPNGTSAYANTFLNESTTLLNNNSHISFYSRTDLDSTSCDIGVTTGLIESNIYSKIGSIFYPRIQANNGGVNVGIVSSQAFYLSNRVNSSQVFGYRNTTKYILSSNSSGRINSVFYLAANYKDGVAQHLSSREQAFASIGDGLTDTEATNFYNSVQKFQTTLGRQIGSPIVSDTDAQAFINATGLTDLGQANAVNTLVVDLKAAGVWSKMKALYPFVGGTAASHRFNLKDPRDVDAAFRIVFYGGMIHTSLGMVSNYTTSYADTRLTPSTVLSSLFSQHVSVYSQTSTASPTNNTNSIGEYQDGTRAMLMKIRNLSNVFSWEVGNGGASTTNTDAQGFYLGSVVANNSVKLYKNNTNVATNTTTFSGSLPTQMQPIGKNENKTFSFASIGDGLTDNEATAFYTAVQKYQTTLGRQVGTPVLASGQTAGLLETYTGAKAAYSLRKLRNGYYGFAIRVRRSSDNAEQDIAFDASGNLDTVSLLAFVGSGNGFVTTWYDQSGNGKHAYQISASNQPRIVLGGAIDLINNKPSLKFTNGQMLVTTQSVLGTGNLPYSVYGVSYNNATADSTLFFLGADNLNASNEYLSLQVNTNGGMTNFRHFWGTGFGWSPGLNVNNRQQYYYIGYDGSTKYSSANNTDLTNTQVITINLQSPILKIGQLPQVSEYYKGYHQELILFNSNSSSTTTGVKSNINSYYSIY